MKQITKYIGLVAIVAIFAIATVSGSIDEADAKKAEGKPGGMSGAKSYGSANDDIVCGDKLCASGEDTDPVNEGKAN